MSRSGRIKKRLLMLIFAALFLVVSTYIMLGFTHAQGEAGTTNVQPLQLVFLITTMLGGIMSSYVFEKAKSISGETMNLQVVLDGMLSHPKFIMALFVSPLIFNSVYLSIGDGIDNIRDYMLAFQNGFFWQSVVGGMIQTQNSQNHPLDRSDSLSDSPLSEGVFAKSIFQVFESQPLSYYFQQHYCSKDSEQILRLTRS